MVVGVPRTGTTSDSYGSNLIEMAVLPLQFSVGEDADSLEVYGVETFGIPLDEDLRPGQEIKVTAAMGDEGETTFTAFNRCDTEIELRYYRHGRILHDVPRPLLPGAPVTA